MSVADAASTGDELVALEAMRAKLAVAMDEASPQVVAQVAARLQAVLERITELRPPVKESLTDVLAERRKLRAESRRSTGGGAASAD